MEVEGLCYLRRNAEETSGRIFLQCPYAKQVLDLLQLQLPHGQQRDHNILTLMESTLQSVATYQRGLLANAWYGVRYQRTLVWQRKEATNPDQTARSAKTNLKAYLNLEHEGIRVNNDAVSSWKPPRQNAVKINVDFTVDDGNGTHGFGIVIRDGRGSFLVPKSIQGWGSLQSERGELMAIKEGLLFAMDLEYPRICLKGDSQVSINMILDE